MKNLCAQMFWGVITTPEEGQWSDCRKLSENREELLISSLFGHGKISRYEKLGFTEAYMCVTVSGLKTNVRHVQHLEFK